MKNKDINPAIKIWTGQFKLYCDDDTFPKYWQDNTEEMTELLSLRNIGNELEKKLMAVGIKSAEDLKKIGREEAFARLKLHYPNVCLVHLYTLEGAISDTDYNQLPEGVKNRLKNFSDSLK